MAQYPVTDEQGLYESVNFLLAGPGGLGQNFAGFSSYTPGWVTGNFRLPFGQSTVAQLYVQAIDVNNAEQLDDRTIRYTFTTSQATAPFSLGNGLTVTGIVPSAYNSAELQAAGTSINQIGVIECTKDYVIVRTVAAITGSLGTYVSGGSIGYTTAANYDDSNYVSTDCNARVTVTSVTDRVFISSQLDQSIAYNVISGPSDFRVWVVINRYAASPNNDPTNPDFIFERQDPSVSQKIYTYPGLTGTGTIELETIFSTVIDRPGPGYYWYILELVFEYPPTGGVEVQVITDQTALRSLSAQVVKQ